MGLKGKLDSYCGLRSNPVYEVVDPLHDVIMCAICYVSVFWGNSLSFRLKVLDFVSGTSDDRRKAEA